MNKFKYDQSVDLKNSSTSVNLTIIGFLDGSQMKVSLYLKNCTYQNSIYLTSFQKRKKSHGKLVVCKVSLHTAFAEIYIVVDM